MSQMTGFEPMPDAWNVTTWWNEDLTGKWAWETFGMWWVLLLMYAVESFGAGVVTARVFKALFALGMLAALSVSPDPTYTITSLSLVLRAVDLCLYVKRPTQSALPYLLLPLPLHHLLAPHPTPLTILNLICIHYTF
eukprot:TRINITY_DN13138_c0_g1_i1.p2 TRINITY_DN13138_c0_g1~~TRINITY_DN13138_c0_g1_i1.p2  ORF type:complete len:137 (+),score=22.30 TRINITY_DN13138_c0_g1_i1:54-464(+)